MTLRDQTLNLHNQGLTPEEIVAALSTPKRPLGKGEVVTKIAQCRREDPAAVRPDGVSAASFAADQKAYTSPGKSAKEAIDLCALVKAWNTKPDLAMIGKRFGIKPNALSTLLSKLRRRGVPLKKQETRTLNGQLAAIKAAAASVLSRDELQALTQPKGRITQLPTHTTGETANA